MRVRLIQMLEIGRKRLKPLIDRGQGAKIYGPNSKDAKWAYQTSRWLLNGHDGIPPRRD